MFSNNFWVKKIRMKEVWDSLAVHVFKKLERSNQYALRYNASNSEKQRAFHKLSLEGNKYVNWQNMSEKEKCH